MTRDLESPRLEPREPARRPGPWALLIASVVALGLCLGAPWGSAARRRALPAPPATLETVVGHFGEGAVATDRELASRAAVTVLERGGNAADAAAAAMLALGVVNPSSSGLGGGGFALYYDATATVGDEDQGDPLARFTFLDFRERAPASASEAMFEDAATAFEGPASAASQRGGAASGVPGEPAGIAALVERFGRLPMRVTAEPAVRLAREGFEVDAKLAEAIDFWAPQMRDDPTFGRWLGSDGSIAEGERLVQPELARTLEAFGRRGAPAIYRGRIAREIVRANRDAGGLFTLEDLARYRVETRAPVSATHFGFRWVSAPPPSAGGTTLLQSLAMLAALPARWHDERGALLHALIESWKGPYLDRQRYFGDPDYADIPLDALLDPQRAAARAARFHPLAASPAARYDLPLEPPAPVRPAEDAGTSHLCVVDREGNVAAVTTTVNLPFGARYSAAGFPMNDQMDDFARAIGVRNAFGLVGGARNLPGPGHRPVSTMSPTIVLDGVGRPVLCVGASGGSRIVTAVEQVAIAVLLQGVDVGDAIALGRVHHQADPDVFRWEEVAPLEPALLARLRARGHVDEPTRNLAIVQAIHIEHTPEGRVLHAASDPRKGGIPAGIDPR